MITASHDGTVIVWDVKTGAGKPAFTGHQGPVFCAVFSPDDKHAVSAGYDRRILAWNPDDIKHVDIKKLISNGESANPAAGFRDFEGHKDAVRSVEFSPDGSLLLSASFDNTVRVWSFESNEALQTFRGHGGAKPMQPVSLSDGRSIISASHDKTVREWSVSDREEIRTLNGRQLNGHPDAVSPAAELFARQKPTLQITGLLQPGSDKAWTWDVKTGTPLLTLDEGHMFLASNAVFFPIRETALDGRQLADNTGLESGMSVPVVSRCGLTARAAVPQWRFHAMVVGLRQVAMTSPPNCGMPTAIAGCRSLLHAGQNGKATEDDLKHILTEGHRPSRSHPTIKRLATGDARRACEAMESSIRGGLRRILTIIPGGFRRSRSLPMARES